MGTYEIKNIIKYFKDFVIDNIIRISEEFLIEFIVYIIFIVLALFFKKITRAIKNIIMFVNKNIKKIYLTFESRLKKLRYKNNTIDKLNDDILQDEDVYCFIGIPNISKTRDFIIKLSKGRFQSIISYLNYGIDWYQYYNNIPIKKLVRLFWNDKKIILPQVMELNCIENDINMGNIIFDFTDKKYKIPAPFESFSNIPATKLHNKKLEKSKKSIKSEYENHENLRLFDIKREKTVKKTNYILYVQGVDYFDYTKTNLILDAIPPDKDESVREFIHKDKKLKPMRESPLGNNLGINMLVFTTDGTLIIQKRSPYVNVRPNGYCSSASGTMEYEDIANSKRCKLSDIYCTRELILELGLPREDILKIVFLGITRELIRGGEPELFFFAIINTKMVDIKKYRRRAKEKWEVNDIEGFYFGKIAFKSLEEKNNLTKFTNKFDDFIKQKGLDMTVPLITNLALWKEYRFNDSSEIQF